MRQAVSWSLLLGFWHDALTSTTVWGVIVGFPKAYRLFRRARVRAQGGREGLQDVCQLV